MISYMNATGLVEVKEILYVQYRSDTHSLRKTFIVQKMDLGYGQVSSLNIDGKTISAKSYEIGEWSKVGDR